MNFPKTNTRDIKDQYFNLSGHLNVISGQQNCYFFFSKECKQNHWYRNNSLKSNYVQCGKSGKYQLCHVIQILPDDLQFRWRRKWEWLKVASWLWPWHTSHQKPGWLNILFWIPKNFPDIYFLPLLFHSQWRGTSFSQRRHQVIAPGKSTGITGHMIQMCSKEENFSILKLHA